MSAAPVRCACCGTEKLKHGPCPSCGFGWNAPAAAPNSYPVGRRLPDLRFGEIHTDIRPGDYWKILNDEDGTPRLVRAEGKLTETCWYVVVPLGSKRGYGLGRLEKHTVREHEDGSITVAPGDGSSNSIFVTKGAGGPSWHGYIERGVFREA